MSFPARRRSGRPTAAVRSVATSPRRWRWPPPGSPSRCAPTPTCRSTSTRRPISPTHSSARCCRHGCERTWTTTRRPPTGAVTLDLTPPASALAIGAHPDDVEFGCGGLAREVGGARVHRAPPRLHRRLEGHVGRRGRHRRARRAAPGRTARGGPAVAGASTGEVRFLGQVDGELDSDLADARRGGPGDPRTPARGRARPRPVEAVPAAPRSPPRRDCSRATGSSPPATRTSSPSTASPTTARTRCCCGRPTSRTTSRT